MGQMRGMLVLAVAASLAACGGRSGGDTGPRPEEVTTLSVQNDAFESMRIYVWRGSSRVRVGIAQGKQVTNFVLPRNMVFGVSTLRVEADPIGGSGRSITEEVAVSQGEVLVVRISP